MPTMRPPTAPMATVIQGLIRSASIASVRRWPLRRSSQERSSIPAVPTSSAAPSRVSTFICCAEPPPNRCSRYAPRNAIGTDPRHIQPTSP